LRGQVHAFGAAGRPVIVTYHPAYLLRTPADKAKAWQDLLRVKDLLGDREAGVEPAS
jgi:uracil-DNA glycosylase family 4